MPIKNVYICIECRVIYENEMTATGHSSTVFLFLTEDDAKTHLQQTFANGYSHGMGTTATWTDQEPVDE